MVLPNIIQLSLILFSLIAGIITGVLFDIYRVIRGFEVPNKFLTFIEDILFWILASIIVFIFLLYSNEAIMGIYIYIFIGLGVYIYMKLFSKKLIYYEYRILKAIGKVSRIIFNLMIYPFELLFENFIIKNKNRK